ncbi:MAG: phospho-N-acetylmuramoyl-pentapeptide-transferase [Clostridia bacterium]|nr:phospho-N-acetylmuramoyl-pentapeptide-transferase [Clostridia bacterium]
METRHIIYYAVTLVMTFCLTVAGLRILIPKLRSMKMGQKILDIGPRWHKSKEGTPTMGGLAFIVAMTFAMLTVGIYAIATENNSWATKFFLTYAMALCYAFIGVSDDLVKFRKKQNEGLTPLQKMLLQFAIAVGYLVCMKFWAGLTTELYIPYFNVMIDLGAKGLGWLYYVIAVFLIVGIVNSVNLTDGIDGLASSVTTVVGIFFTVTAFRFESLPPALVSAMTIGGCLGFLVYNFYPARVFMGDTGSLFLGGIVVGLAFMIDDPLIILVVGFIYVLEAMSDIIQVICFKLTGKRVFKMAPIHHHFEKCGWSEIKIVIVFSIITAIFGVLAYFGINPVTGA